MLVFRQERGGPYVLLGTATDAKFQDSIYVWDSVKQGYAREEKFGPFPQLLDPPTMAVQRYTCALSWFAISPGVVVRALILHVDEKGLVPDERTVPGFVPLSFLG